MKMWVLAVVGVIIVGGGVGCAWAQPPSFFVDLPDVPLMAGMVYDPAAHVMFDTAAGEIVEEGAFCIGCSEKMVEDYYRAVLSQLGWSLKKPWFWERNKEQLIGKAHKVGGGVYLTFALTPKDR